MNREPRKLIGYQCKVNDSFYINTTNLFSKFSKKYTDIHHKTAKNEPCVKSSHCSKRMIVPMEAKQHAEKYSRQDCWVVYAFPVHPTIPATCGNTSFDRLCC